MVRLHHGIRTLEQLLANTQPVDLSALASDHAPTVRCELRRVSENVRLTLSLLANITEAVGPTHPDPEMQEAIVKLKRECLTLRMQIVWVYLLSWGPTRGAYRRRVRDTQNHYGRLVFWAARLCRLLRPGLLDQIEATL